MKKQFLIITIISLVLVSSMIVRAQNELEGNESVDDGTYTYQENMKDKNCFYNFNFCNAGMDQHNLSSGILNVVNTLKGANYQLSTELNDYKTRINNYHNNQTTTIIAIWVSVLCTIWATYLTIKLRRLKNEKNILSHPNNRISI